MPDRCVLFSDLLAMPHARQRGYVVHEPPGLGLACLDARSRVGPDWLFARRWVSVRGGSRELYRWIDRLEAAGFRFRVATGPPKALRAAERAWDGLEELNLRASEMQNDLTPEERRLHAELFPEETRLLERGYDWDGEHVYRKGAVLCRDAFGRVLDTDGDMLYEWVRVEDEFTWRRYPLERVRATIMPSGT